MSIRLKSVFASLCFAAAVMFAGCGDDDDNQPTADASTVIDAAISDATAVIDAVVAADATADARVCVDPTPGVSANAFCAEYQTTCGFGANRFANLSDCVTQYNAFITSRKGCAAYHLCNAGQPNGAAAHCPHATGTSICI